MASIGDFDGEATTGSIHLTLPKDSSFHLDAHVTTGRITNDFPAIFTVNTGKILKGEVGSNPTNTVRAKTTTGSITIRRGN